MSRRNVNGSAQAKASATKDRILGAAARSLGCRGYSETRLGEIAEAAQLQAPALYYYFESREALISEVMAVGQRKLLEHVQAALEALPEDSPPIDRICAAVGAHLEVALELSDFATAVTRNRGQLPEAVQARLREEGSAYIALWRDLLEQARNAGEVRADLDLRAARMLIMGALNWAPEWWNPDQGSLERVIETAKSLVRGGLTSTARMRVAEGYRTQAV